jgi:putative membrane protein
MSPNSTDSMAKVDDKKFAKDAALGGMAEVQLGKLATQKASRDDIKQFGQKIVDDHTKANDQLKELASKENIPIPDALDSKHQARIDKLSKLSGENFDKAFVVSWNFKHIVHFEKIGGYEGVNSLRGYRSPRIYSPREVVTP